MRITARSIGKAVAFSTVAALALAGCSGGPDDETGDDGEIVLSFHTWLPPQDQWPEISAEFEKENPGIRIEFDRDEDFAAFKTSLDNKILADEVPDIYGIQVGAAFDDYAEYAMPVEDWAGDWIDGVNAESRKQTTTTDGVEAAVPMLNAGMEFYIYNKTLIDEVGLELPTTYDELVAFADKARAAGYTPFAMGAADTWHVADFFVWMSNQFGAGGDVYKAAEGEIPWDSDSLVEAAAAWQKLFTDGVFQDGATSTTTYPQARDDYFLAGKALAMPTGSWHVGMSLEGPDREQPGSAIESHEVGMAAFPTIGKTDAGATTGVDFAIAISDELTGERLEAASKFVEFMALGKGQQIMVRQLQGFPAADGMQVEIGADEPELGRSSVDLVTETLAASKYPRKLSVAGKDSLENDLGVVLQNIAGGADPATELATLNQ